VLVATRNPLNVGAAARAMSNFGFLNLCLVNPYEPSFREARSAVGASELLAKRACSQASPRLWPIALSSWEPLPWVAGRCAIR
jgi:hypothetical protein